MRFIPGSKIHITREKAEDLREYAALPGDVIISRSGTVGEVCVVPEGLGESRISTNLMRVRLTRGGMIPKFFCLLFNGSPFVMSQISELCSGSTRDFLNTEILTRLHFPLPPLAEQEQIIAVVEHLSSVIEATVAEINRNLSRAARLRQSILKQAFEGKLVAQDPADEPASVLLARIKEQRPSPSNGKRRKIAPRRQGTGDSDSPPEPNE